MAAPAQQNQDASVAISGGLAFFPWWSLDAPRTIGPIRLVPFVKGQTPEDLPHVTQRDLETVLHAYATRPHRRLRTAALLEVDGWQLGEVPDAIVERLFAAKEALAFSGLATRRLFEGHFHYCCYDDFSLVVQRFIPGKGEHFAYHTRRRDGGMQQVWSTNDFAFHPPLHVNAPIKMPALDEALVVLLMAGTLPGRWHDAVYAFNHANTDSPDIPEHVEMVMLKSAFEQLLDISESAIDFQKALTALLPAPEAPFPPGPLTDRWRQKFPASTRLLEAWAREFCARRGAAAHGVRLDQPHFVWAEKAHLAFGSMLFPLIFKLLAAKEHSYPLDEDDLARLAYLEAFIAEDPFVRAGDDEEPYDTPLPWAKIDGEQRMRAISRRIAAGLDARLRGQAKNDGEAPE